MPREYRYISADAHLVIPLEWFMKRVPHKYEDLLPKRVRMANGGDSYVIEGQRPYIAPNSLFAGKTPEEYYPLGLNWDSPGTGPPEQRLQELDTDGLDAEVLYPDPGARNVMRGVKGRDGYLAVLRAYNDYLAEEFCSVAPDRLLGLGLTPETSVDDAIAEMEHCVRLGHKGLLLSSFPSGMGYPSDEDDRFWAAAVEMNMPLTVHVAFDKRPGERGEPFFKYPREPVENLGPANFVERLARYGIRGGPNAVQLVMYGVFDRFPTLGFYWAEEQFSWVPLYLQQMDHNYERHRHWAERTLGIKPLARLPSEYIREHNWWGFFDEPIGVRLLRYEVGVDRVMWGGDFPHAESEWPNSLAVLDKVFAGVPEEEKHRMVAGNAIDFFHLEAATPGAGQHPTS